MVKIETMGVPSSTTSVSYTDLADPLQASIFLPPQHRLQIIITASVLKGAGYLGFAFVGKRGQPAMDEQALYIPFPGIWAKTFVVHEEEPYSMGTAEGSTWWVFEKARATSGPLVFTERSFDLQAERIA